MTYDPLERPRRPAQRSILDSPLVAGLLVVIVVLLAALVVLIPGVLGPSRADPTASTSSIPGTPVATGPTPVPTFSRPTPSPAPTFLIHRVTAGESLNSIARQFRTTARSIAWWNRGAYPKLDPESPDYDPNTIRVGWVLVVLPDTVVDEENPPTPSPGPPTPTPGTTPDPIATPEATV